MPFNNIKTIIIIISLIVLIYYLWLLGLVNMATRSIPIYNNRYTPCAHIIVYIFEDYFLIDLTSVNVVINSYQFIKIIKNISTEFCDYFTCFNVLLFTSVLYRSITK